MLDLLVKSALRRKIVGLFVINCEHELYAGQVARVLAESAHAVGLELRYLAKGDLLKTIVRGRHTFYVLNKDYGFVKELTGVVKKMHAQGNKEICSIPDLSQRQRIKRNLEKVLEDLKRYYDPEKVILFGSTTLDKVGPYSDIDLLIVKKTSLPYFKRLEQLVELLNYDVDIDFLVYTPEEFEQGKKEKRFLQEEILKKGQILYEKTP